MPDASKETTNQSNISTTSSTSDDADPILQTTAGKEYYQREVMFQRRLNDITSTDRLFVRLRIAAFVVVVGVGIAALGDSSISGVWILLPIALFALVLKLHQPTLKKLRRTRSAHEYYQQCISRLKGNWREHGQTGSEFAVGGHSWSSDLDVFGEGSLFQKLNQCKTLPGQRKLAAWLTSVPSEAQIKTRQIQAESLKDHLELRERLASIDRDVDWKAAEKALSGWISENPAPFPKWALWGARALGITSLLVVVGVFTIGLPGSSILIMLLLQAPFVVATRGKLKEAMEHVDDVDVALRQLAEVTAQFEAFPFTDKSLQQLQGRLQNESTAASDKIAHLSRLINWLNNGTRNQFFIPLAWMLGLFVHLPYRIDRWRNHYGPKVNDWLDAATELEVINSIAAFNYENETYSLPTITEQPHFEAIQIGHPLLPSTDCVRNDVTLSTACPLMLISGSNMSGKSTLLRSVGINTVLSFLGARVNATSMSVYPFHVATAMRVSDSLQEGRSLFFTVVQRLKTIVDLAGQDHPVLFLLDEILSGTNSHDRRTGAEAVIRTLVNRNGIGMVTTHDLTLTRIVDSMDGRAINMHFEDQVLDGQMSFDYQLRNGIVERSNAIELMRMMGLDV